MNAYDVAAVYYDWDNTSVERLQHILDSTGAMAQRRYGTYAWNVGYPTFGLLSGGCHLFRFVG